MPSQGPDRLAWARRISAAASGPPTALTASPTSTGTRAACGLSRRVRKTHWRSSRTDWTSSVRFARASEIGCVSALLSTAAMVAIRLVVQTGGEYNQTVTASTGKQPQNRHTNAKVCHHFAFHYLTCDEYDQLRKRADGRCEICKTPEEDVGGRRLVIDHDERPGMGHLVRGLICSKCNSVMSCLDGRKAWGANRRFEAAARVYAANSWHQPTAQQRQILAAYDRFIKNGGRTNCGMPGLVPLLCDELIATRYLLARAGSSNEVAGDAEEVPDQEDKPASPAEGPTENTASMDLYNAAYARGRADGQRVVATAVRDALASALSESTEEVA